MPIQFWIFLAGLAATIVFGLIGGLLKRSIDGVDKKLDATSEKVDGACQQVNDMRLEMTGYSQLVSYLRTDVLELKTENKSLREAHAAIDKHIAVQQALQAKPSTN